MSLQREWDEDDMAFIRAQLLHSPPMGIKAFMKHFGCGEDAIKRAIGRAQGCIDCGESTEHEPWRIRDQWWLLAMKPHERRRRLCIKHMHERLCAARGYGLRRIDFVPCEGTTHFFAVAADWLREAFDDDCG